MPVETRATPHVWVGCLGCYNAGELRGEWVDATEAADVTAASLGLTPDIYDQHEELWVFDFEGFDGLLSGECSPMEAQKVAEAIAALDEWTPVAAFAAYIDWSGADVDDRDGFQDAYCGEWDSEREYAENLADDLGAVNHDAAWPASYIDWDAATRDLFMDYHSAAAPGGGVYVFRQ